jgi:glycosyltransferase involved in cell wall biosynthesis
MQQRHLLHVFSTFAVGGPQVRLAQLANHFGARYRHSLLALDGNYACRDRIDPRVDLEIIPFRPAKQNLFQSQRTCRNLIRRIRPDLLVTYNWGAIEWALANRWRPLCPHVHQEDGFGPEEATRQLRRRILLRRWALRGSHSMVVVPSRTLLRIATGMWGLAESHVRLIPNGVDLARFGSPGSGHHGGASSASSGEVIVGTVAKLRAEKNIGRLIRAFAAVEPCPRSRLIIVGDGVELERLKQTAAMWGVERRVEFAGACAAPERMMARMDVFALSSDTEQMPLSVIEAMAAGLPIAGVDVGDVGHMVSDANRPFIAPKQDEAKFRKALQTLITDAPARRSIGRANRAAATQRFDQGRMFAAYAGLFN